MGLNRVDWGLVVGLAIHVAKWAHSPNIVNIHYRFQNLRTLVFSLPWQLCPHPCVGMVTGRGHCVRVATNCWHHVPMFQCSNVPMLQCSNDTGAGAGHSLGPPQVMLLPASTSQDLDPDSFAVQAVSKMCYPAVS